MERLNKKITTTFRGVGGLLKEVGMAIFSTTTTGQLLNEGREYEEPEHGRDGNFCQVVNGSGRSMGQFSVLRLCRILVLAAALLLSSLAAAQSSPKLTGIDPASGKVNDTVTVFGSNLGKDSVTAVFLSDDKTDYKAVILLRPWTKL